MAIDDAWAELKARKNELSSAFQGVAPTATISAPTPPLDDHLEQTFKDVIRHRVESEPYWFQRIELFSGYWTPGWSDPVTEKLPYFALPDDLSGKRVLDIGCSEGYFSFEAERRGAREVIAIDSLPDSVRRFNIVRDAKQSNASAYLVNVYDLDPEKLGTFDVVLFYGVFYHLKHPQLALERIKRICVGDLLFQTVVCEEPAVAGVPWARYHPHGTMSGSDHQTYDPTNFWFFNSVCCVAMLDAVGFSDIEIVSSDPHPFVIRARVPDVQPGCPPDQTRAPWS
jgi:tRNA (mo5U34)-methyltransferase